MHVANYTQSPAGTTTVSPQPLRSLRNPLINHRLPAAVAAARVSAPVLTPFPNV
ncbi:hypothetical protein CBM2586_A10628 [Cupriavidus phytorum]|uniref:Uncharacterized protein n=1 Tax=Cupriavidus taiwanensis TaxID=164546 RepID=A0A975WPZ5_9BURK|nr:hypothetical protein CBM2586_A10628 [Cupriavidus taiwanensis]